MCFFTGARPKLGRMSADAIAKALPFSTLPGPGLAADKRRAARHLFWQGWAITTIAAYIEEPRSTVQGWKDAEEWDKAQPVDRVEAVIETRMAQLVMKDNKTGGDYKEIDLLGRQIERLARVHKYEKTGKEADLNPAINRRNDKPKKQPERNHFNENEHQLLLECFAGSLFGYQKVWREAHDERTRFILKSRQIGATWYFAREALADALETGRNQIFLSASKAQAHIFKQYIIAFAKEACGVELSGDPIVLSNGATLYFLGTNALTAQGYDLEVIDADTVLIGPSQGIGLLLLELGSGRLALRAELRRGVPLMNISTNGANKLFHRHILQFIYIVSPR